MDKEKALLAEYTQVCENFRELTEIRFKLLAFLPVGTALAVAFGTGGTGIPGLELSVFGLAVTLGLVIYHTRNDQLYGALVARGAYIERLLELPDGMFATRSIAWRKVLSKKMDHSLGVQTVYLSALSVWVFGLSNFFFLKLWPNVSQRPNVRYGSAIVAILIVLGAAYFVREKRKEQEKKLRVSARDAAEAAVKYLENPCDGRDTLLSSCYALTNDLSDESVVSRRAEFYLNLKTDLPFYIGLESEDQKRRAALLVSALTDFPPLWIYDCHTNRRGAVKPVGCNETKVPKPS